VDVVYVANIHPKHYETVMIIQAARDKGVFFMEVGRVVANRY